MANAVHEMRYNFVVSPLSVWMLLASLADGASGNTYKQMEAAIHLPSDLTHVRAWISQRSLKVNTSTIESTVNQAIHTDVHRPILKDFANILEKYYDVDHVEVNFRNADEAAKSINDHVKEQMRGKMMKIVNHLDVTDAHLLATSTAYFKGRWKVCD